MGNPPGRAGGTNGVPAIGHHRSGRRPVALAVAGTPPLLGFVGKEYPLSYDVGVHPALTGALLTSTS